MLRSLLVGRYYLLALLFSSTTWAGGPYGPGANDETILVERSSNYYSGAVKLLDRATQRLFGRGFEHLVHYRAPNRASNVRAFSEYADRVGYRFKVKKDRVSFKVSVNL